MWIQLLISVTLVLQSQHFDTHLLDRSTQKHPVILGPMLIHQRKTTQTYHFFASSIVGLRPQLSNLQAFGTGGEKALEAAFQLQFKGAIHLLCFIHVKDAILQKLRDIGICGDSNSYFIQSIFGRQEGTHRFEGLVDCDDLEMFETNLKDMEQDWNKKECELRSTDKPVFFISCFVRIKRIIFLGRCLSQ